MQLVLLNVLRRQQVGQISSELSEGGVAQLKVALTKLAAEN